MHNSKHILAIIPARAGSKGIPGKNTVKLGNKPLIGHTIEAAQESKYIDEIFVTTDSTKIVDVVKHFGIPVNRLRPAHLATDTAKGMDVILDSLEYYESLDHKFDVVIVLQPTSPLRTTEDIDKALETYFQKNALAVVSVCKNTEHPFLSNTLPPGLCMKDFLRKEIVNTNRQDMPDYYRLNGAIYIVDIAFFKKEKTFYGAKTFAFIMPLERSVDIDEPIDLLLAGQLLKIKKSGL